MTRRKIILIIVCAVAIPIAVLNIADTVIDPTDSIVVTVPFKGSMSDHRSIVLRARITSVSRWLDRSRSGTDKIMLESLVQQWVSNNGMELAELSPDKEVRHNPDLRITVETDEEVGFPRFGRHFKIMFGHVGHIHIRFTDPRNEEVVAEARYSRPFLTENPPGIFAFMLDRMVQKRYGLTDFSTWERRNFPKSRISLDLPHGFYGYGDRALSKWSFSAPILSLRFHERKSELGRVHPGLAIYFEEMQPDRYSQIKQAADRAANEVAKEYFQWRSAFHEEVSRHDELPVRGGPPSTTTIYIRDYRNRQGRTVRAMAVLYLNLRPEGPSADDRAVRRMLNSVEVQ